MAGELITGPGQLEWRGVLVGALVGGPGIYFDPGSIEGLEDLASIETSNQQRARSHGSIAGPLYSGDAFVTIRFQLVGGPYIAEQIDVFEQAMIVDQQDAPLVWDFGSGLRRRNVRLLRRALPVDPARRRNGTSEAVVQWIASDPRVYSNTLQTGTTGVGSVSGGLGFPHGFPHGFGSAEAGTIPVTNGGTTPAPWTATLTGPLTSPRISLLDHTGDLAMNGFTLDSGDTLEFDSLNRTILLNGTASRISALTTRSWFDLPTGASAVQLTAGSGIGSLVLAWRDTYL